MARQHNGKQWRKAMAMATAARGSSTSLIHQQAQQCSGFDNSCCHSAMLKPATIYGVVVSNGNKIDQALPLLLVACGSCCREYGIQQQYVNVNLHCRGDYHPTSLSNWYGHPFKQESADAHMFLSRQRILGGGVQKCCCYYLLRRLIALAMMVNFWTVKQSELLAIR